MPASPNNLVVTRQGESELEQAAGDEDTSQSEASIEREALFMPRNPRSPGEFCG
jgi:hypothetical protein